MLSGPRCGGGELRHPRHWPQAQGPPPQPGQPRQCEYLFYFCISIKLTRSIKMCCQNIWTCRWYLCNQGRGYLIRLQQSLIWLHSLEYWIFVAPDIKVPLWRHSPPNFCGNVFSQWFIVIPKRPTFCIKMAKVSFLQALIFAKNCLTRHIPF